MSVLALGALVGQFTDDIVGALVDELDTCTEVDEFLGHGTRRGPCVDSLAIVWRSLNDGLLLGSSYWTGA